MGCLSKPGSNAWGFPPPAKSVTPKPRSLLNTASLNAPTPNAPRRPSNAFGSNAGHHAMSPPDGLLFYWAKQSSNAKMTHLACKGTMLGVSPTTGSPSISSIASSFIFFGPRGAKSIWTINTPLERSFNRPGWPLSKSAWPPGRPLAFTGPLRTWPLMIELSKPLGLNGVT